LKQKKIEPLSPPKKPSCTVIIEREILDTERGFNLKPQIKKPSLILLLELGGSISAKKPEIPELSLLGLVLWFRLLRFLFG